MAKANELITAIQTSYTDENHLQMMSEMVMIGLPLPTVKALSDAAAVRNLTLAQILSEAINDYLRKTESRIPSAGPKLLTEG